MDRVNEVTRDVFSTVGQLRFADEQALGDPGELHGRLRTLITDAMRKASSLGFSQPDVQDIGYVLTALIDEVVLLKGESLRDYWVGHMLQLEFFNENVAGQGVFDRLQLLMNDPSRVEVLQVYHLALMFGFQGKYRVRGGELELADVTDRAGDAVRRAGVHKEAELSPHGLRPPSADGGLRSNKSLIYAALGALAVALIMYGIMAWSLSSRIDDLGERYDTLAGEID